jgi:hypothetical protein
MEKLSRKQAVPVMANDKARASFQERIVKRRSAPLSFLLSFFTIIPSNTKVTRMFKILQYLFLSRTNNISCTAQQY